MPVVGIPVNLLLDRISTRLDRDDLVEHLQHLGCDVEGYATVRRFRCLRCDNMIEITETENPPQLCDRCGADYVKQADQLVELGTQDVIRMELLAVRPDMFDPGGLARVLRNYLGESNELARYELAPPSYTVEVDSLLATDECFRPAIACAIVRDITLTDDLIKVIMKLQENLHWAMGRDRKHASIGIYDLDTVSGPDLEYRSVKPRELRFTPLGYDPQIAEHRMTPEQILEQHPKGQAYARLLKHFDRYPLLIDRQGQVLSMPPIINSEETRVKQSTRNFFIDVTGTGERIVNKTINMVITSLAELDRGARIEQVTIAYLDRKVTTPDLTPQTMKLERQIAERTIGVELGDQDLKRHLNQMGHAVEERDNGELTVYIPAYRNDIMHPIDLVEDIAIAYGYHNIIPQMVPTMTVGRELPIERDKEVVRRTLTGLGYMEIITLTLSSKEADFDSLLLPHREDCVLIDNPISVEQTIVRTTLVPGLLDTFSVNTNHEMPQRFFEVGNISLLDTQVDTGAREWPIVCGGATGPRIDYSEIRSTCEALLREFGWSLQARADTSPCFIPGRGAVVVANKADRSIVIGRMGELHPQILENYKLIQPMAFFEIDLDRLVACPNPDGELTSLGSGPFGGLMR